MHIHPEAPQLHVYICLRGLLQAVSMVDDDNLFPTVTGSWVLGPGAAPAAGWRLEHTSRPQVLAPCLVPVVASAPEQTQFPLFCLLPRCGMV